MNEAKSYQVLALSIFLFWLIQPMSMMADTDVVDANQNIFGAGKSIPPQPSGGGGGALPLEIDLTPGLNRVLFFTSVTGSVNFANGAANYTFDADGNNENGWLTDVASWDGISGIVVSNRIGFLTGCFLTDDNPTDPPPASLLVSNVDFVSVAPQVAQLFFIGDGKTSMGQTQVFRVPDQATRLFLGFVDAYDILNGGTPGWYDDNLGQITASFQITQQINQVPVVPPIIGAVARSSNMCSVTITKLIPGLSNQLFSATSLSTGSWALVQSFISPGSEMFQCVDTNAVESVKFYRVQSSIP